MTLKKSALFLPLLSFACVAAAVPKSPFADGRYTILNIVPMRLDDEGVASADALELYEKAGVEYPLYSLTLHPEGKPAMAKVERAVASYRRFADGLKGTGVRPGILLQAIVGHWPRTDKDIEPWQRTINIRGEAVRFCAFDPRYQAYIREVGRRLAAEHPSVILADDDVRAFSPQAECFCPLHAAEYGRRLKRDFTSDSMRDYVASLAYDHPDHRTFVELQKDTVMRVLEELRAGIDEVDPSIPGGCCQSGWVWEHDRLPDYARAMSGGARPFFRLGDGNYTEGSAKEDYPGLLTRSLALFARYEGQADLLAEVDTWPQNLWAKSAAAFHANLAETAFMGASGAKAWLVNCHRGDIPVTRHYTKALVDHRGYYDALRAASQSSRPTGFVQPCYGRFPVDSMSEVVKGVRRYAFETNDGWIKRIFGTFGIPFRVTYDLDDEGCVYALGTRESIARFTDDELKKMLKHRVVIEGDAVGELLSRGFGDLIGVRAADDVGTFTDERHEATGRSAPLPASSKPTLFEPLAGAETLSSLVWRPYGGAKEFTRVTSAATLCRNELGGRVLCLAYHFRLGSGFRHSESRKRIMLDLLAKLSADDLEGASLNDQNMISQVRKGADGMRYVHLTNLNPDFTGDLRLRVTTRPGTVEVLSSHGEWRTAGFTWNDGELVLPIDLPLWGEAAVRWRDPCEKEDEATHSHLDFRVRDPFVLVEKGDRPYLMYMSDTFYNGSTGVSVTTSADLKHWTKPVRVMTPPAFCAQVWAPEVHRWKDAYYMFVTLKEGREANRPLKTMVPGEPDWHGWPEGSPPSTYHAVWVFRSASPFGPFEPVSNGPIVDRDWDSLDGTLAVQDGKPWMVFTHDWAQVRDGTYELAPMSDDLTRFLAPPKTLFRASDWKLCDGRGVTDGAFLYRSPKSGKLFMIWSSHNPDRPRDAGYCVLLCESATGRVEGPWKNHRLLYDDNGGHGMFFHRTDGQLMMAVHNEKWGSEHPIFLPISDDGDALSVVRQ